MRKKERSDAAKLWEVDGKEREIVDANREEKREQGGRWMERGRGMVERGREEERMRE